MLISLRLKLRHWEAASRSAPRKRKGGPPLSVPPFNHQPSSPPIPRKAAALVA